MLYQFITRLYDKKVDPIGLSFFRIAISMVLFAEVFNLLLYRRLIFDVTPYLEFSAILDYKYALLIWLLVIVCLIFGLFTRVVVILNYVFSVLFFATNTAFGTHMIQVFMTINFLLLFTNVSAVWSLDAVLYKLRTGKSNYTPKVSVLNYYSFVFMALGLVYFISLFDKYFTSTWLNGTVIYVYRSLPDFGTFDIQWLLNQKWIMMGSAYFALAFETLFIVVCFNKKWRPYICVAGMAFHFGIFLFLPIPEFALGFMALYLLLVPFSFWRRLRVLLHFKPQAKVLLNVKNTYSKYLKIIIESLDVFKFFSVELRYENDIVNNCLTTKESIFIGLQRLKKHKSSKTVVSIAYVLLRLPLFSFFGLLLYMPFLNLIIIKCYKRVLFVVLLVSNKYFDRHGYDIKEIDIKYDASIKTIRINLILIGVILLAICQVNAIFATQFAVRFNLPSKNQRVFAVSSALFGITNHNVLTDTFDKGELYGVGIAYEVKSDSCVWLPLTKINGEIGSYKKGSLFYKGRFRNFEPHLDSLKLKKYTKDFTAFWGFENNIDLDNADFKVFIKKYDVPSQWEKNVYKKNLDKPWISLGKVIWRDTLFSTQLDLGKVP